MLHTGDWKLDPDPLIGLPVDEDALRRLGDEGVLAMIRDSTNALRPVPPALKLICAKSLRSWSGAITRALPSLASHRTCPARLETIAHAAAAHGREVALVGRSLWRNDKAARENGYLSELPRFLPEEEAAYIPRDRILMICTGSQGEPRSALAGSPATTTPMSSSKPVTP